MDLAAEHTQPNRSRRRRRASLVALVVATLVSVVTVDLPAAHGATPFERKVNFATSGTPVPAGYENDIGAAYSPATGAGWFDAGTGAARSVTADARYRPGTVGGDTRLESYIHMQKAAPAGWQQAVPNGSYDVTVAVGDPQYLDSVHRVVVEGVVVIDSFVPTTAERFRAASARVSVTDGFLTVLPTGGTNTKIVSAEIAAVDPGPVEPDPDPPAVAIASPDDGVTLPGRLHFASPVNQRKPARSLTVTNAGTGPLVVTGLSISGPQAAAFVPAAGQPTTFTLAPGASAPVAIEFRPLTGAPAENNATFSVVSNAPAPTPTVALAGIAANAYYGSSEPSLQSIVNVLGLGGINVGGTNLGGTRLPKGDEVTAPYFVAADPTKPVTFLPVARYLSATSCQCSRSGWGPKGTSTRNETFFVSDNGATGTNFNQTLLPTITGSATFTPSGPFGLYTENGWWLDDGRNASATHLLRVYPAERPDGTVLPNTYLIGLDYGTGTAGKNFDFQDIVFLAKNVRPEVVPSTLRPTGLNLEFTNNPGSTVLDRTGVGTGFQGVQANTAGTQLDRSKLLVTTAGGGTLAVTSTNGTHVGRGSASVNNQVNALESVFDGSRYKHSVTAQLRAPFDLGANGQFEGLFYGPGQDDFLRVGLQRVNGVTQLVAFYEVQGVGPLAETFQSRVVATATPNLSGVSTVQVRITADVSNGTVQASYQLNGAGGFAPLGAAQAPKDVMRWFAVQARAGVVTSNAGSATPFTSIVDSFKGATA